MLDHEVTISMVAEGDGVDHDRVQEKGSEVRIVQHGYAKVERDAAVLVTGQINRVLENVGEQCLFHHVAEHSQPLNDNFGRLLVGHDLEEAAEESGEEEGVRVGRFTEELL